MDEYPSVQQVLAKKSDKASVIKISSWVSPALKREIDTFTKTTGTPISWLIRNLLETWAAQRRDH